MIIIDSYTIDSRRGNGLETGVLNVLHDVIYFNLSSFRALIFLTCKELVAMWETCSYP